MTGFELRTSGIGSDRLPTEPHHCPNFAFFKLGVKCYNMIFIKRARIYFSF